MLCNGVYIHHLWGSYWIVWSCIANNSTRLQTSVSVIREVRTGLCKLFSSSWESTQAFLTCSDTFRHHCWNSKELFVTQNRNCTVWFPVFFSFTLFHCAMFMFALRAYFYEYQSTFYHKIEKNFSQHQKYLHQVLFFVI